ncbi:MAG: tetratricopeptide repeat protein [Desulfobacter sp.]|nr:MAG: tetratricopeptide repeat protein [Desulfobacter sp.]
MGKKNETMVSKQTFYMAILVSVTFGFMIGAVYTSFKLANKGNTTSHVDAKDPHAGEQQARIGASILKLETFLKENPDNVEAWIQLGNLFFDSDRFSDDIDAYEKSLSLSPGNSHVLTDLGVMYRRNKAPEKAIKAFDMAIAAQPGFETPMYNKGIVFMHDLGDLSSAIKAWEALVAVNPAAKAPNGKLVSTLVRELKIKHEGS